VRIRRHDERSQIPYADALVELGSMAGGASDALRADISVGTRYWLA
jgi:hypothetical protein